MKIKREVCLYCNKRELVERKNGKFFLCKNYHKTISDWVVEHELKPEWCNGKGYDFKDYE